MITTKYNSSKLKVPSLLRIVSKGVHRFIVKPDGSMVEIWEGPFVPQHINKYAGGKVDYSITPSHPAWSWADFILWKQKEEKIQDTTSPMTSSQIEKFIQVPIQIPLFEDAKEYYPSDFQQLVNALRRYRIATRNVYKFPVYDCGDFAFAGMGVWHLDATLARMACFIVWVEYPKNGKTYAHALLGACDGKEFKLIEPQNYLVFAIPNDYTILVLMG